jgi:hypothetical protein
MLAEQTTLQRVATLVARGICHAELFAVVNQEIAQLLRSDAAGPAALALVRPPPRGVSRPSASLLDSLVAAVGAELVLDVAHVGLDGVHRQVELTGDLRRE